MIITALYRRPNGTCCRLDVDLSRDGDTLVRHEMYGEIVLHATGETATVTGWGALDGDAVVYAMPAGDLLVPSDLLPMTEEEK